MARGVEPTNMFVPSKSRVSDEYIHIMMLPTAPVHHMNMNQHISSPRERKARQGETTADEIDDHFFGIFDVYLYLRGVEYTNTTPRNLSQSVFSIQDEEDDTN
jgi:hypothetical protein